MDLDRRALGPPKKPLLTEKDVAARGWPPAAIEEFLGEPDVVREGRRYHDAGRVVAAEALPPVAEAIRRHRVVTQAALRKRGWSRADIAALLGEPDLVQPGGEHGGEAPTKLYRVGRVEDAESARTGAARFYSGERTVMVGPSRITLRGSVGLDPALAASDRELAVARASARADEIAAEFSRRILEVLERELGAAGPGEAHDRIYAAHSLLHAADRAFYELETSFKKLAAQRQRAEAEAVMAFYLESFPKEGRRFEYFCGPTNSGKTHAAIEELRASASGAYLAPLRLLALEVYERLNDLGVPTSLLTGEERIDVDGAAHVSSTVEMADVRTHVDVAVIDEAQMLEDPQRGWAWTLAALGVRASRIILCGSIEGLRAARGLARRLDIEFAVRRFRARIPSRSNRSSSVTPYARAMP